jgi:hypothetical protein
MSLYPDASLASGIGAFAITPHDTNELSVQTRAIYIGGSGNLKVEMVDGSIVTFVDAVGILPIMVKLVYTTGTTATSILGIV